MADQPDRVDGDFHEGLHSGAGALTSDRQARGESRHTPVPGQPANEGARGVAPAGTGSFVLTRRSRKGPADTAEGCRQRAAADRAAAAAMPVCDARLRHEHSAAQWGARADLLQQLNDGYAPSLPAAMSVWPIEGAREVPRR